MKKYSRMLAASFLILIMALLPTASLAGEIVMTEPEDHIPQHLTVASATHLSGNFYTELWGRNTSDLDVQSLLHGYNLVQWNEDEGMFIADPSVVSSAVVLENKEGDRGYLLTLYEDLYFSDGSPVTAWDYAFSWLLSCSDELAALGVATQDLGWMKGFEEYKNGEQPYLEGLRVTADRTLLVIIDHAFLPFFYEMGLLNCIPSPIHVIAPGVRVFDDGNGVYLANDPDWEPEEALEADSAAEEYDEKPAEEGAGEEMQEPRFTAELLAETILDPESGYLSHPSVVSGPYTLASFDQDTAEFAVNLYYKGDAAGNQPLFETLTYRCLENESMIPALLEEEVGLLNKVTDAETIHAGMEQTGEQLVSMSNYARTGLTFIGFSRTSEKVASRAVRQALAWSLDREELTEHYTGSYGLRVDGYYGLGQWMYRLAAGHIQPPLKTPEEGDTEAAAAYEAERSAWAEINLDDLTAYTRDLDFARSLLEADGWKLPDETDKEALDAGDILEKDDLRLELTLAYPEGNRIAEDFEEIWIEDLKSLGISLTLKPMPMEELLDSYYLQIPELYEVPAEEEAAAADADANALPLSETGQPDLYYLGSNFSILFAPQKLFAAYAPEDKDLAEADGNEKEQDLPAVFEEQYRDYGSLYTLAVEMNRTEPGDVLAYMQKWVAFQEQFNEVLPMIPVYSNVYFDFYTPDLQNYRIAQNVTWGNAILGAYLQESGTQEEDESGREQTEISD